MRGARWLLALALAALPLAAQEKLNTLPCKVGATCSGVPANVVTTTGTLASGQVALGSGATSITGDAGCTWTGTGASFVATFGGGLVVGSEAALFNTFKGANSDGLNLFIGGGGQSSTGAIGETYKGSRNTFFGIGAGQSNTTGANNIANGYAALNSNTTGAYNIANGYAALNSNTTGAYNTANGMYALYSNTTGTSNTANGMYALFFNTTGDGLVALGNSAGRYETGSNAFYVNNIDQGNTAGDKAYSLLYGTFAGSAGTTTGNMLRVNGVFEASTSVVTPVVSGGANATGTNIAGTTTTVAGQLGTGTGASGDQVFTVGTPQASGATQHVAATALTLHNAGTGGTAAPQALFADGTPTDPAMAFASTPGQGFFNSGSGIIRYVYGGTYGLMYLGNLNLGLDTSQIAFGASGDALLNRRAAANLNLGAADTASPISQTLSVQGSRAGTDTNVAGGDFTVQSGAGTGSATGSSIVFQTPTAGASGTTGQTQTTRMSIAEGHFNVAALPVYANNAAALAGNLVAGDLYRTNADPDPVCVVH